jgi:type I restriction enzyme M protein
VSQGLDLNQLFILQISRFAARESKRKENEFAWRMSIADFAARGYNLDVKNPHTVDDAHRDPSELLAEYQKAQAAVAKVREKLRKELETALESKR